MEGLSVFLVLVSMFSFLICLVLLIINAIKKKPFKVFGVGMGLAVGVFFIACLIAPSTDDNKSQENEIESETIVNTETESQETKETQATEIASQDTESVNKETEISTEISEYDKVKNQILAYIDENYTLTDLDDITVNEDMGTDEDGDYVVLVNLTWNQKNKGSTSQEMLDLYSSDMAARTYKDLPEVQELCIFWTVPYLNDGKAKISFERTDGGMVYTDKAFDEKFN